MKPTRTAKAHTTLALIAICFAVLTSHAAAAPAERWYVLEMQQQRAGWTVEREHTEHGNIVSTSESHLAVRRGSTEIVIRMSARFVETADGEPVEMTADTDLGGGTTRQHYIFQDDGVLWTSTTDDRTTSKKLPLPEGRWLPPAAASRYTAKRIESGADEITVRSIDPLNGLDPVTTTRSGFEPATIEVLGRSVAARRCTSKSSLYPDSLSTEYIDEQGNLLRSELSLGAMSITVIAADKQLAQAKLDPPELMRSLFVTPNRSIDDPYRKTAASYIVRATEGTLPEIPSAGSQTATRIDESSWRISRDLGTPAEPQPTPDTEPYLAPSAMLDCADPRVAELARTALAAAPDNPQSRAEAARRFVHRYIRTKDLSVGFATASETARTREGDCTEHAVLLAAMLRADGIPSRVVSGLIYADRFAGGRDIFGYHMWTQALIEINGATRWVDLDATLPDPIPMTATHIALGLHALEGDSRANALVELAPLMGRLSIEIESIE